MFRYLEFTTCYTTFYKSALKSYILWREKQIVRKFYLTRKDIYKINANNAHAKHRILSALKIHDGNMDQELKIIPWKLDVMRLTSQSHYSETRTWPSTNFIYTILLKKRHGNLFLKFHSHSDWSQQFNIDRWPTFYLRSRLARYAWRIKDYDKSFVTLLACVIYIFAILPLESFRGVWRANPLKSGMQLIEGRWRIPENFSSRITHRALNRVYTVSPRVKKSY